MTVKSETVEREAMEADEQETDAPEPDETDDEPETEEQDAPEPDSDPEPEAPPAVTEAQLRKIGQDLDREDARHLKASQKILGEFWVGNEECALCQGRGYLQPFPPNTIDPAQAEAVDGMLGRNASPTFRDHPTEVRCVVCDGWGEMLNGSRRAEQSTSACQTCMGTGHTPKPVEPPANVTTLTPPAWTPPPTGTYGAAPNEDAWGRPMGHQHWGIPPAQAGA